MGLRAYHAYVAQHRAETQCSLADARVAWAAVGEEDRAIYKAKFAALLPGTPALWFPLCVLTWLCKSSGLRYCPIVVDTGSCGSCSGSLCCCSVLVDTGSTGVQQMHWDGFVKGQRYAFL